MGWIVQKKSSAVKRVVRKNEKENVLNVSNYRATAVIVPAIK